MIKRVLLLLLLLQAVVLNAWFDSEAEIKLKQELYRQEVNKCISISIVEINSKQDILNSYYLSLLNKRRDKTKEIYKIIDNRFYDKNTHLKLASTYVDRLVNVDSLELYVPTSKKILRELKQKIEEEPLNEYLIDNYIAMMYAWTIPFEYYSTKEILDASLLTQLSPMRKKLSKLNAEQYTEFIGNLLIPIEDISSKLSINNVQSECASDTKFQTKIAKYFVRDFNNFYSSDKDFLLNNRSRYTNQNTRNIIFVKIKPKYQYSNNLSLIKWNLLFDRYTIYEKFYYSSKKMTTELIESLKDYPRTSKRLEENLRYSKQAFIVLNKIARYNIVDLPVALYLDRYYKLALNKISIFGDDEEGLIEISNDLTVNVGNKVRYLATDFARQKMLRYTRLMKKTLSAEEYEDLKLEANFTEDEYIELEPVTK